MCVCVCHCVCVCVCVCMCVCTCVSSGRGMARLRWHSWEYNVSLLCCSPSVKNIRWFSGEMSKPSWRNREQGRERGREGVRERKKNRERERDEQTLMRINNDSGSEEQLILDWKGPVAHKSSKWNQFSRHTLFFFFFLPEQRWPKLTHY